VVTVLNVVVAHVADEDLLEALHRPEALVAAALAPAEVPSENLA
jgi:hypothetical protein